MTYDVGGWSVRLRSLGQCAIEVGDIRIVPDADVLFATLLYLLVEGERHVLRGELAELVWPDVKEIKALHNLRQAVYRLKTFGVSFVGDRSHLAIDTGMAELDFTPLLATRSTADAEACATRIHGPFLPGYAPRSSPRLLEWVERQRDVVNSAARRVLMSALQAKRARGDWHGVDSLAKKCLAIDPLNEEATCAFAEVAAMHGSKSTALTILDTYLKEIGPGAREIRIPATTLRRRISEAQPIDLGRLMAHVPFVGREDEMALLHGALQSTLAGEGGGCLIWGEPGIGKTRLVSEFTRAAQMQSARVVRTGCQSHDERRPLSAFVDLVPKLLTMPGGLGCSPETMGFLKRLTEHDPTVTTLTPAAREAEVLYFNIRRSLFDLLDAIAAETCVILVVEDVHWLDAMSWELFAEMSGWLTTRRILLVLTSREAEPPTQSLAREPLRIRRCRLVPLRDDTCRALLRAMSETSHHGFSEEFQAWCVATGGGNPYYLTELAMHGLAGTEEYRVPASLTALIDDRLSRLQPMSLLLLQASALWGKLSTLERLEAVVGQQRIDLIASLDELERSGLTQSDGAVFCSRHDLLSSAAVTRLSGGSRRLLHRHAALHLGEEAKRNPSALLMWECAEHWQRAGEAAQACEVLRSCAHHALELGVPNEAFRILRHAMTLAKTTDLRGSLLEDQVRALSLAGEWTEVRDLCDQLFQLRQQCSGHDHDDIELIWLQAKWRAGDEQLTVLKHLCSCATALHAEIVHRVRAATAALMLAHNLLERDRAVTVFRSIEPLLASPDLSPLDSIYPLLVFHSAYGDKDVAAQAARQLVHTAQTTGSVLTQVMCNKHATEALLHSGHVAESIALGVHAYELAVKHNFTSAAGANACNLMDTYIDLNDLAAARLWEDRLERCSTRSTHSFALVAEKSSLAELALRTDMLDDADRYSEEGAQLVRRWPCSAPAAHFLAVQLQVALRRDGIVPSDSQMEELIKVHDQLNTQRSHDWVVVAIDRLLRSRGEHDRATQVTREYVEVYRVDGAPLDRALVQALVHCERATAQ